MAATKFKLKKKAGLWLLAIPLILIVIFFWFSGNISPVVGDVAEARVRAIAYNEISKAIEDLASQNLDKLDIMTVTHSPDSKISYIKADTMKANHLANIAANAVNTKLSAMSQLGIDIPLGTLSGSDLFAGRGPLIRFHVMPVGSVTTDFDAEFEDAGINQIRHRLFITVHVKMRVILPSGSRQLDVSNSMLIAETIIVGTVPNTYIKVADTDQMLNLIPIE